MPLNKSAFYRYLIIDKAIKNKYKPFPSKEEIRKKISEQIGQDISESQLEKDIQEMKNSQTLEFYAPIEFDRTKKGYFYTRENFTIGEFIRLHDNDFEALDFALDILNAYKDSGLFTQFKNTIEKINSGLKTENVLRNNDELYSVFFPEINSEHQGLNYMLEVAEFIKKQHSINITYQKFDNTKKVYLISPYALKEFRARWYLIALQNNTKKIKVFGLDRVKEINASEENIFIPSVKSINDIFNDVYGITIPADNDKPEKIELKFKKEFAAFLITKPLHHSQKIKEETEEFTSFEFFLHINYELIGFILGWGDKCVVQKPKKLKDSILKELNSLKNLYSE